MSWGIHLMKAPVDAVTLEDVPEGYGTLGTVAEVVERLRSVIPKAWFDAGRIPTAWFTTEDIWGGVDCHAYSLRIHFDTVEDDIAGTATPVNATDIVKQVFLVFQRGSDPYDTNPRCNNPIWDFVAAACRVLDCRAEDDTRFLGADGRPIPLPEPKRPWWRFWR
jgi:hypothetical protein